MIPIDESTCVVRNDNIPTGEIDGELVALDLDSGHCFGMDRIGSTIWQLAAEPIAIRAIADALVARHDVDRAECMADILPFIEQLLAEGLLHQLPA